MIGFLLRYSYPGNTVGRPEQLSPIVWVAWQLLYCHDIAFFSQPVLWQQCDWRRSCPRQNKKCTQPCLAGMWSFYSGHKHWRWYLAPDLWIWIRKRLIYSLQHWELGGWSLKKSYWWNEIVSCCMIQIYTVKDCYNS